MRARLFLIASLALVTGCATVPSAGTAICDGTRGLATDHARALVEAPDGPWIVTGARLIAALDAGCGR